MHPFLIRSMQYLFFGVRDCYSKVEITVADTAHQGKDERDIEIKDLKKNLRKKDAALAEVSALLILQKKANLLWPSPNEDEAL